MQFIDPKIEQYALMQSSVPSPICDLIETKTRSTEAMAQMLTGPMEASFLGFMIRSLKAQRVLEIGTFTGYSALAMAENLPEGGELHTIDIQRKDYTSEFWNQSPHGRKIHFHLGRGLEVIPTLPGTFDVVFIDADKENYSNYFKLVESRLSPGGVVIVDNVLWSGRVLLANEEIKNDPSTLAIKEFNEMIQSRTDLYKTLLPIRDGLFLIQKIA